LVIDILLWIPAILGLIGAIGLIKLPNVYTRTYASSVCAVGCTCLLLLILTIKHFYSVLSTKYLFLMILILLTSPTASHAIANAAYKNKIDLKKSVKRARRVRKKR